MLQELFGTRLAVANLELRLPMVGPLGVVSSSGVVPPFDRPAKGSYLAFNLNTGF